MKYVVWINETKQMTIKKLTLARQHMGGNSWKF